jgi:hypothetical protein
MDETTLRDHPIASSACSGNPVFATEEKVSFAGTRQAMPEEIVVVELARR